jgi:hypothetical protein
MNRKSVLSVLLAAGAFWVRGAEPWELSSAAQEAVRAAQQGSIVRVTATTSEERRPPAIPIRRSVLAGPRLLFSDMPEYFHDHNGLSMAENVTAGAYRLYIYHVPGTTNSSRTVSAVIENLSPKALTVRFAHYAFPPPGTDYAAMGVEGLTQFFTGHWLPASFTVAPGGKSVLDPKLDATVASDPQLVHAFYEFDIDGPARVCVLQRDTNQSSTEVVEALPPLPPKQPSGAGRGIFPEADFAVTNAPGCVVDTANGVQRLVLSDGASDPWVLGTDALSGNMTVTNKGSYGVIYHIKLAYASSDGRSLAILIGARGGRRGGEARPMAAIKISGGVWPEGWVSMSGGGPGLRRGAAAVAQVLPPPPRGATNVLEMIYSPPGGSSLPTPIFFAPFRP